MMQLIKNGIYPNNLENEYFSNRENLKIIIKSQQPNKPSRLSFVKSNSDICNKHVFAHFVHHVSEGVTGFDFII